MKFRYFKLHLIHMYSQKCSLYIHSMYFRALHVTPFTLLLSLLRPVWNATHQLPIDLHYIMRFILQWFFFLWQFLQERNPVVNRGLPVNGQFLRQPSREKNLRVRPGPIYREGCPNLPPERALKKLAICVCVCVHILQIMTLRTCL